MSLASSILVTYAIFRTSSAEDYALYAVCASVVALLPFLDSGLGLALVSTLPRTEGLARKNLLSTTLMGLWSLAGVFLVLWFLLGVRLPWAFLLGLTSGSQATIGMTVVVTGVALNAPASFAYRVLFSDGETGRAYAIDFASQMLVITLAIVGMGASASVIYFLFASIASSPLVNLLFSAWWLIHNRSEWKGRVQLFLLRRNLLLGITFVGSGFAGVVANNSDLIIVAHLLGDAAAAELGVNSRLGVAYFMFGAVALTPLWPRFARMLHGGDFRECIRLVRRSIRYAAIAGTCACVGAVAAGPTILRWWTGGAVDATRVEVGLITTAFIVQVAQLPLSLLINALGEKRFILVSAIAMLSANVPLSILFTLLIGLPGPALGTVAAVVLCNSIPMWLIVKRTAKQFQEESSCG